VRPRVLGALLDAAAHGLRRLSRVQLERSPRMADFALWATACETAFWPSGTFLRVYDANRRAAIEGVIEADPVAALCGRSWPCEALGQEGPRIFYAPVLPQANRRMAQRSACPGGPVASLPDVPSGCRH
jgi:hypothetical protein